MLGKRPDTELTLALGLLIPSYRREEAGEACRSLYITKLGQKTLFACGLDWSTVPRKSRTQFLVELEKGLWRMIGLDSIVTQEGAWSL